MRTGIEDAEKYKKNMENTMTQQEIILAIDTLSKVVQANNGLTFNDSEYATIIANRKIVKLIQLLEVTSVDK